MAQSDIESRSLKVMMNPKQVLITGGYGCIGAETAKWILRNTPAGVVICSRSVSPERSERVFHDIDLTRMTFIEADVTNQGGLERILREHQITHVAHMAALQTPDCNANRDAGLQINLAGTQNIIEAMKSSGSAIERYVFASSIAVYGPRNAYPAGPVPMLAEPQPVNVYGAWKLAGEQISKFYCEDTGVPTLCIRPGVLFGPGRDAGLTSSPTTAMKCVALGLPYAIPFCSRQDYLYAPDVGAAFAAALMHPFHGFGIFTLPSHTADTARIVAELRDAAAELDIADRCRITVGNEEVPFICDLDFQAFTDTFPTVPHTPLDQAVRSSLEVFLQQVRRGWLTESGISR